MKEFIMQEKQSRKLGDKIEYFYEMQESNLLIQDLAKPIADILESQELTAADILDSSDFLERCDKILKLIKLYSFRDQQDALAYVTYVLELLAKRTSDIR